MCSHVLTGALKRPHAEHDKDFLPAAPSAQDTTCTSSPIAGIDTDCRHAACQLRMCMCRRFRILAAGGDGTVAWILKTIHELRLEPPPQVAVMPLGTGNDLSLSFGWGNTFLQKWVDVSTFWCSTPWMEYPHSRSMCSE